ncbi:MAG TPA: tRNA (guanosine(37)-N1)-methyltransferase TrmD [Phycisphaerae bacterium]|nr:tRNA (guanosine(37)-N1)-methyltransferase TrmD [Phycisphaerae bacterium]HNU43694.1 tRNA (guanosine(37)-N1)-methyltransferase TrmD [Phycisphaerae bacterium]
MRIDVLTLFPEVFGPFLESSIVGRAVAAGVVSVRCVNYRDFTHDRHRSVDDRPFGGGPGMVLRCGPVFEAVEHLRQERPEKPLVVLLTPQGEVLTQALLAELEREPWLVLICGHYEGFDERIRLGLGARQVSIGDYVLSGGEPAAMVVIDGIVRLLPGALGHEGATGDESFARGLLEYPQYTRPRDFRGMGVPEVLLSGDHARIEAWRREQALARTRQQRPDLLGPDADTDDRKQDCGV